MFPVRSGFPAALIIVILWLTGCGGGGGDDDADMSTDASLSELRVSTGQMDQVFHSSQLEYSVDVDFLTTSMTVVAIAADANASVRVNGVSPGAGGKSPQISLAEGVNPVTIAVTAEDATTTRTYTLTVNRDIAANFAQRAYVKASNPGATDQFGWRLALSGDTLAVGAYAEASNGSGINSASQSDNSADFSGAVYVFARQGGVWSQQAYVKASNSQADDRFGYSLALSGDTLAVGAYAEDSNGVGVNNGAESDNSASASGAVYVFVRDAGAWSQQAYIKASNTEANDQFGWRVALSDDTLAVGASGESSNGVGVDGAQGNNLAAESGAVYLFTRSAGEWAQQAYIKASNTGANDYFGASLALSGDTLAVGAWGEDGSGAGINSGAQASNSAPGSGAVYVFSRRAGSWSQQAYIKAHNSGAGDLFGYSLALSGDTLAVGAHEEDSSGTGVNSGAGNDGSSSGSGAVYVFTRVAGNWSQEAYVKASINGANDKFGYGLALAGNTLAIGAYNEDSNGVGIDSGSEADDSAAESGAVYLLVRESGTWNHLAYIKASNSAAGDFFGADLSLSDSILAIGAYAEDSNGTGVNSGAQADDSLDSSGAVYLLR